MTKYIMLSICSLLLLPQIVFGQKIDYSKCSSWIKGLDDNYSDYFTLTDDGKFTSPDNVLFTYPDGPNSKMTIDASKKYSKDHKAGTKRTITISFEGQQIVINDKKKFYDKYPGKGIIPKTRIKEIILSTSNKLCFPLKMSSTKEVNTNILPLIKKVHNFNSLLCKDIINVINNPDKSTRDSKLRQIYREYKLNKLTVEKVPKRSLEAAYEKLQVKPMTRTEKQAYDEIVKCQQYGVSEFVEGDEYIIDSPKIIKEKKTGSVKKI